ncbi:MAG: FAD-dependent oxidoreductase [Pseudonocardiaceae bacterium]|nr:FAD-dependent oxidoreductase [Pseudonocardiaceae bacterium]
MRIVVVGASLAGLSTVEALRKHGFDGAITVVGDESLLPYDRPPLSKQVLSGSWQPERGMLRTDEALEALDTDLLLGTAAVDVDATAKMVDLADGSRVPYDALVIATGAKARPLSGTPQLAGVQTLRTLDDAIALKHELDHGPRVVVIGGGFVGAEVAAEARRRELDVTIVEMLPVPLSRGLGEQMGTVCAQLHTRHGTRVRCGRTVSGLDGTRRVERVRLDDESSLEADLVVVGVGAAPAVDWLRDSGIELGDGVHLDAYCRASAAGVYAVGDVARWFHQDYGCHLRLEHWTNAKEQAAVVARNILSPEAPVPYTPVPYVWSDQYGSRIQIVGRSTGDAHVVNESADRNRVVALYRTDDRLVGAFAINAARQLLGYRRLLAQGASWQDALAA